MPSETLPNSWDPAKRGSSLIYFDNMPVWKERSKGRTFPVYLAQRQHRLCKSAMVKNPLDSVTMSRKKWQKQTVCSISIVWSAMAKKELPTVRLQLQVKWEAVCQSYRGCLCKRWLMVPMFHSITYGKTMGQMGNSTGNSWMIVKYIRTLQPKATAPAAEPVTAAKQTAPPARKG